LPVAAQCVEHIAHETAHVALEVGFSDARLLKIELVEHLVVGARKPGRRMNLGARPERHAQRNDTGETVRTQQRRMPRNGRAPVVSDDDRFADIERIEHADHIADQMQHRVLLDLVRAIGAPIAAHIDGDRAKAFLGQHRNLMAPRVPALGKAVAEQHRRAVALFHHVDVDAVRVDCSMNEFRHGVCSSRTEWRTRSNSRLRVPCASESRVSKKHWSTLAYSDPVPANPSNAGRRQACGHAQASTVARIRLTMRAPQPVDRMRNFLFSIDGEHFLLDGAPLQIRSAELHPARIPAEYWLHRIRMAKAMGMNTIALYVMWNYHETSAGAFDFVSGNRDIGAFIGACQAESMWVLLRPGPYVCAEWDLGGLPSSLLAEPAMRLRTDSASEPRYMAAVARYIRALAVSIAPLMIAAGGPILMIQIENEFGSYGRNPAYLDEIRALWVGCGIAGPFYTEDGLAQLRQNRTMVSGGAIALSNGDAAQIDAARREFPHVPVMAGEVYPGWLTHWGDAALQGTAVDLSDTLDTLMRRGLSFNLYVAHGGTSFGFYAGANLDPASGAYQPDITSYDYAAPISEQGVATPKFVAYRNIVARYLNEALPDIPPALPTIERRGRDALRPGLFASLWDNLPDVQMSEDGVEKAAAHRHRIDAHPQTFEQAGQAFGFALYRHAVRGAEMAHEHGIALETACIRDYATVFVDGRYVGAVSRARVPAAQALPLNLVHGGAPLPLLSKRAQSQPNGRNADKAEEAKGAEGAEALVDILVEGMGRINYGAGDAMLDRKGIVGDVVLRDAAGVRHVLTGWDMFLLPMDDAYIANLRGVCSNPRRSGLFFRARFELDTTGDTYLDMSGWTKGVVWVNGHNLGRYWHIGPQTRLFCPAPWLKRGENVVTIFDLHQTDAQPVELRRTLD
jgi:beta-galactosidase